MQVHQLRYFCAVASTRNFTRAAEREHVSQPSLSQQVLKLEDELGAKLFDRLGRAVQLTPFGEVFLPRAEAIPTIAPYFLPARLSSFACKYRHIQVSVIEEITPVLLKKLQEAALDMAIMALPIAGETFVCQELLREPLYLVLPPTHRLARHESVHLKQIENDSFLLLKEGHCFRENALAACGRAKLQPNVVFESGQFATILAMVAAGTGVSIVPHMAVEHREDCCFVPLADRGAFRRVGVVQLKQHFRSRAQRAFLEHLRHSVRQDSSERLAS